MSTVFEYPDTELADTDYHAFNLALWEKLADDPVLVDLDFRIETDRHGQMIMSPPPAPSHGNKPSEIARLLGNMLEKGRVVSKCPLSTREGVKAIDVAWCTAEAWQRLGNRSCFREAPEICVEVVSPRNTKSEIAEKKALYFEEGAAEVWICERDGTMQFFHGPDEEPRGHSERLPDFPTRIG
jgi:Uma2 family endonuclease